MCVQVLRARAAAPQESTSVPPTLMKLEGAEGEWSGSVAYSEYERAFDRSFRSTERQPLTDVGLTHASSVMALVRWSRLLSVTVTHALVPLKESAPPNSPAVVHVALASVPVRPWPEASAVVVPVPSLKP